MHPAERAARIGRDIQELEAELAPYGNTMFVRRNGVDVTDRTAASIRAEITSLRNHLRRVLEH